LKNATELSPRLFVGHDWRGVVFSGGVCVFVCQKKTFSANETKLSESTVSIEA